MIPAGEIERRQRDMARRRAIERASEKCPVILAANRCLDRENPIDALHAIDLLMIDLAGIPEAGATRELMKRVAEYGGAK